MTDLLTIDEKVVPKFPKHVKLRYNKPRDEWVILAPERLVKLDKIAVEILQLVDGVLDVNKISLMLSKKFAAPLDVIKKDVISLLQTLAEKGFIIE
tara:strand:+ start:4244 stop:4531 length:288 start_codon:yes stop_codon:yes gene_type:complete